MSGRPCIFGEVLFDHFPDGKRVLGGAPFNVAWHLQAFGQQPLFISRVGDDPEGAAIRGAMQAWGMETGQLQSDPEYPTGRVAVSLDAGEPSYDIVHPCAYDRIEAATLPGSCALLYHGSLALREDTSRYALERLKASDPATVFVDVNLRPPWWQQAQALSMIKEADWVKLNSDELAQLSPDAADAQDFLQRYGLQGLVLTHGSHGAEVFTHTGDHATVVPQTDMPVVDTVGAGDAFASVIILGLLQRWPLALTLQRAQEFASHIVGRRGATVDEPDFYAGFIKDWQLT